MSQTSLSFGVSKATWKASRQLNHAKVRREVAATQRTVEMISFAHLLRELDELGPR